MHVPDEAQVVLVAARLANGHAPLLDGLENLGLHAGGADRRALGEAADELIEKLLGGDLEVKGVAAVLDANIEQVEGEQGDVGVALVDVVDNGRGSLARRRALFAVDEVRDLEVERQVGLVVVRAARRVDVPLDLRRRLAAVLAPAVAGSRTSRGCLHGAGLMTLRRRGLRAVAVRFEAVSCVAASGTEQSGRARSMFV